MHKEMKSTEQQNVRSDIYLQRRLRAAVYSRSLIRIFTSHNLIAQDANIHANNDDSDCAEAQADLSLRWAHI